MSDKSKLSEYVSGKMLWFLAIPVAGPFALPCFSLVLKFLRAEGVLFAINLSLLLKSGGMGMHQVLQGGAISLLVLAQLYGFNDAYDAAADLQDPDKPHRIAALIVAKRPAFLVMSGIWAALLIAVAYFWIPASLFGVVAMIVINILYSAVFKGIPLIDVTVVIFWGACFPFVTGVAVPFRLILIVGIMTGISHIWQTMRDRDADENQNIRTIAVFSKLWSLVFVFALCAALATLVFMHVRGSGSIGIASLCFAPALLYFIIKKIRTVWILSKVVFAGVWYSLIWLN